MEKKIKFYAFSCSLVIHFFIFILLGWCWAFPKEKTAKTTIEVQLISQPVPTVRKVLKPERVNEKQVALPSKKEKSVQVKKTVKATVEQPKKTDYPNPSPQKTSSQSTVKKVVNKDTKSKSGGSGEIKGAASSKGEVVSAKGSGGSSGQGKGDDLKDSSGQAKESNSNAIANVGDPGVVSPDYEYTTKPTYPIEARKEGLEGRVIVRALVGVNGKVNQVRVIKSSGHAILDQEAIKAVREWRFRSARRNGSNIACWVDIPLSFKLH